MCFMSRPSVSAPPPPPEIKLPEAPTPVIQAPMMTQSRPKTPAESNPLFKRKGKKSLTITMGGAQSNIPGT
jgi:hypothetical protein